MSTCDLTAMLGIWAMLASFGVGYLIARKNIWSEKTNQLLSIESVKTSEGVKRYE